MIKRYLYIFLTLVSSLKAEIPEESMNGIYIEATLFVLVGVIMSIFSYKMSSKHAAEYAIKNQKKIDAKREAQKEQTKSKEERVVELQQMLDKGVLTDDEFKMMKKRMYNTDE